MLAQASFNYSYSSNVSSGTLITILLVSLVVGIIASAFMLWPVFTKAGKPGWASIVPVYNAWVLFEISGKPGWWALFGVVWFVPILGWFVGIAYFVLYILAMVALAPRFGKTPGYSVGLILLPIIFFPIIGYGKAQYLGDVGGTMGGGMAGGTPPPPAAPMPPAPTPPAPTPPAPTA